MLITRKVFESHLWNHACNEYPTNPNSTHWRCILNGFKGTDRIILTVIRTDKEFVDTVKEIFVFGA